MGRRIRLTALLVLLFLAAHLLGAVALGTSTVTVCKATKFGVLCWAVDRDI